jgi:flagella basal body P-ring formation protein FlgA
MIRFWIITAAFLVAVVFSTEISVEELIDLGIREIKSIQRYAGKEVELTFPEGMTPVNVGTENYTIRAELSTRELGSIVYIRYMISDFEGNFIRGFRVRAEASVWTDALYARRTLYKGEEVTAEDFYLKRTDMLRYSRHLADETVFRDAQIITTNLRPGMPLFGWMLSVKRLINSGDHVNLTVKNEGVTLRLGARALQGGVLNDKILVQVQNARRRTMQARITGPGECEVIM